MAIIDWEAASAHVREKYSGIVRDWGMGEWQVSARFHDYPPRIIVEGILIPTDRRRATHHETGHAVHVKDEELQLIAQSVADMATNLGLRANRLWGHKTKAVYDLRPDYSEFAPSRQTEGRQAQWEV